MSCPGDVVWADGVAWQRGRYGSAVDVKAWWVNPAVGTATLHTLRMADDFRWLVKDGHAADWDRVVAERDRARAELAAMTNQRDVAENRYADALAGQLSRAALEERAAIVAWLRIHDVVELGGAFADAIERGDHLGGDDE